jgi:hypothetical protein
MSLPVKGVLAPHSNIHTTGRFMVVFRQPMDHPHSTPSCSKADTTIIASHGDLITCSRTWEGCTLLTRDLQLANAPSASAPTIQLQYNQYPVHVRTPANVRHYSEM